MQKRFLKLITLMTVLFCTVTHVSAQTRKVTGVVVDEMGVPLIGSIVASQDGKSGVMTDEKGAFSINVRSNDQTITISFLGYLTQSADIVGKSDQIVELLDKQSKNLSSTIF